MERGDSRLITEAAVTNVFNFKDGSPLDPEYNIRLKYALSYLIKKRAETSLELLSIYNVLICIQRTIAKSSDLYGQNAKDALEKCIQLLANQAIEHTDEYNNSSEESTIEHFKAIYNQLYGNNESNSTGDS